MLRAVWSNGPVGSSTTRSTASCAAGGHRQAVPAGLRRHESPVAFADVVAYRNPECVVFSGRKTGSYAVAGGMTVPLGMSTTRCFRYVDGYWCQYYPHGCIDDPDALRAYRQAIGA
jgi:hypothetical protein